MLAFQLQQALKCKFGDPETLLRLIIDVASRAPALRDKMLQVCLLLKQFCRGDLISANRVRIAASTRHITDFFSLTNLAD
jgi:hypothetical protein